MPNLAAQLREKLTQQGQLSKGYSLKEFGQLVKQKYPVYQDKNDEELAKRVLQKYPVYERKIIESELGKTQPQTKQTIDLSRPEEEGSEVIKKAKQFTETMNQPVRGAAKGVVSTIRGASSLGEKLLRKPLEWMGLAKKQEKTAAEELIPKEVITPQTPLEKVGFYAEQIAEFLAPSSAIVKAGKGIQAAAGATKTGKALGLAGRVALEGATVGGQTALQKGKIDDDVKTAVIVGAAFPFLGRITSGFVRRPLQKIGEKIQKSVIRPTLKDTQSGFKIENIQKYNLGGSLSKTFIKVENKMNQLAKKLESVLKNSDNKIDLLDVVANTEKRLIKEKISTFGNIKNIKSATNNLFDELLEIIGDDTTADLYNATLIKRGAGTKGAWIDGLPDKDAPAISKVYTTFYNEIKKAIEKAGSESIKQINKQLSEMIPIQNAIIRRIPVAERNNFLSLSDTMGLFGIVFNPRALVSWGVKRLSTSGKIADLLVKAAQKLKEPVSTVGQRILGR